jgi:hypothetical protein
MRHARIISGAYPDAFNKDAFDNIANEDGSINWRAAMWADPGVKSCPQCKAHFWNEADVLECPDCHIQFGNGVTDKSPRSTP